MATHEQLQELLNSESCEKHFITVRNNTKFNHTAQALVALYALNFSYSDMQEWIQQAFGESVETRLVAPKANHPDEPEAALMSIPEMRGKMVGFYRLLEHYKTLLSRKYNNNLDDFVKGEYPSLSDGVASLVLHGLLQIGYGYAVRNAQVTCEGFAYLFYGYRPLKLSTSDKLFAPTLGHGRKSVFDVFRDLPDLRGNPQAKTKPEVPLFTYLSTKHGDQLLDLCDQVFIDDSVTRDLKSLCHWLLTEAVRVYATCEARNNFYVMHLVSGSWALCQLLPLFDRRTVEGYVKAMLCVFFIMHIDQDNPSYSRDKNAERAAQSLEWSELIPRTAHSKNEANMDAHVLKLVAICRELYNETSDAEERLLYKTASYQIVEYSFTFNGKGSDIHPRTGARARAKV